MTNVVFIHGADGFEADAALAASLGMPVIYPEMPSSGEWGPAIAAALSDALRVEPVETPLVLIAHSAGGLDLLTYLASAQLPPIASIHIIAAPFPGGDPDWTFDGFDLPDNLDRIPRPIFLYASEDDEIVPFAHRDLWAVVLPGSVTRTTVGGHQLNNDLRPVAADIRSVQAS